MCSSVVSYGECYCSCSTDLTGVGVHGCVTKDVWMSADRTVMDLDAADEHAVDFSRG